MDLCNTMCHKDWADPTWEHLFEFDFEMENLNDIPLVLMFDILGSAGGSQLPGAVMLAGDHLGSAMLAVRDIGSIEDLTKKKNSIGTTRFKLPLIGGPGMYERRLGRDGA